MLSLSFRSIVIRLIAVVLSMSIHELAHALVSYHFGDPTAKDKGRLSLNPFAHIDWIGLACLLIFGFGWAKPVPVDPSYYKNKKTGLIWTAFAGPMANFILAFVLIIIYYGLLRIMPNTDVANFILDAIAGTAVLSTGFGVFNLIPIPPLDGSKVLLAFLPDETYYRVIQGSPVVFALFFALIYLGVFNSVITTIQYGIINAFSSVAYLIF